MFSSRVPSTPDPSGLSVVMTTDDFSQIRVREMLSTLSAQLHVHVHVCRKHSCALPVSAYSVYSPRRKTEYNVPLTY